MSSKTQFPLQLSGGSARYSQGKEGVVVVVVDVIEGMGCLLKGS